MNPLRSSGIVLSGLLLLILCGCASYNQRIETYYASVSGGDYKKANADLDKNRLLKKSRNHLLYLLEKGRVSHALAQYDTSNYYFNEADKLMEEARTSAGDVVAGTLMNPMMQKYKGEDFEKIMIHYYKALNYLYLGQTDEAVVEARRITLQNEQLGDKFNEKDNRYSKDAFSLMLQGFIYESSNDVNNAFIAYRNAAEIFLKAENQVYYGVKMPGQLKKDVLRTAYENGFSDELSRFEGIFGMTYKPEKKPEGGYAIIFWENGMAPVKEQQDFFFTLTKGTEGFYFMDINGNNMIPFDSAISFDANNLHAGDLNDFHVAFPKYIPRPVTFTSAMIKNGKDSVFAERAEDINELAMATLRQRFPKEMSTALSRLAVKKTAQLVIQGKDDDSKKNKELREGIAAAIDLYSLFSEKADTRNWQTLPSVIYYARVPLEKGKNELSVTLTSGSGNAETKSFIVDGTGRLIFLNYSTLR